MSVLAIKVGGGESCNPFTGCICEINNTQIDNAKDIDVVMPMYNLTEHSDKYSHTWGSFSLWKWTFSQ